MKIKKLICKIINSNLFIEKQYLHMFNKIDDKMHAFKIYGIKVRNNIINVKGKENILICGDDCSIQNNIIRIEGEKNTVEIGNNVELLGNGTQSIYILGNNNRIEIESNCIIRDTSFFITGNNNLIHISKDFSGIAVEFHIEQNDNEIDIGEGTTMHGRGTRTVHIALDEGTKVLIDEDCMFSNDIQIRSSDSHSIVDSDGNRLNPAKDIKIGKHCWLGMRCMLMKGTNIPDFTVVAAGSICTKPFEESNTILAGVPAKVVKKSVSWDRKFL